MNTGRDALPPAIEEELCHDPDVEFVVVFGSQAAGTARASSDLDVAVKFADELSATQRFRKRCRLSDTLQGDGVPFVDLSDVEELPVPVAHAAVSGTFVCGDEDAFETFARAVTNAFEADRRTIERQQREVIRRIAEGGLHG